MTHPPRLEKAREELAYLYSPQRNNVANVRIAYARGFSACAEMLLPEIEKLVDSLTNCRMQFADMMSRVKAPDAWMIQELDEALANWEKFKEGEK